MNFNKILASIVYTWTNFKNREKCQNPEIMKLEKNQNYLDD